MPCPLVWSQIKESELSGVLFLFMCLCSISQHCNCATLLIFFSKTPRVWWTEIRPSSGLKWKWIAYPIQYIFSQSVLKDTHTYSSCARWYTRKSDRNSCIKNEKRKKLEGGVQTVPPFSPPHSWPIMAWSGRECRIACIGKFQKWSDTDPPNSTSEMCGGGGSYSIIRQAVLAL